MTAALYLDTEFTRFEEPQLLSIGLVSDEGEECYCERTLTPALLGVATDFVREMVVPKLGLVPAGARYLESVGRHVARWLEQVFERCGPLEVRYDYSTDMELLEQSLKAAGQWAHVGQLLIPTHVGYMVEEPAAVEAFEQSWLESFGTDRTNRHHALADARALRAAFYATHNVR